MSENNKNKITKTIKLEIIKPIDLPWYMLSTIFRQIRYESMIVLNKSIQLTWEWNGFSSDYKKETGKYPSQQDFLKNKKGNGVTLSTYIYNKLSHLTQMYSGNYSYITNEEIIKFQKNIIDCYKGERGITSFKKTQPIGIKNDCIVLNKDQNGYTLSLKILNKDGVKSYNAKYLEDKENFKKKKEEETNKKNKGICKSKKTKGRNEYNFEDRDFEYKNIDVSTIKIAVYTNGNSAKSTLKKIYNGEYKICGSEIMQDKSSRKWFFNLTYSFEVDKNLDKNNIMGIDMGIVYPVYMAFNNNFNSFKIEGGEIEQFRRKVEGRRNSMLKQSKYCGDGRIGHGRNTRLKPTDVISDKIANFKETCNHKYSRYVIDMAIKNKCGVIQMEDLTGISKDDAFLKKWSYFNLQEKIEYKAKENGIEVKIVDRKYTSQRCSKCGFIHRDNRPKDIDQSKFKCLKCDFETNADYNAARNISMDGIEEIIQDQIKKQDEETKNTIKYIMD